MSLSILNPRRWISRSIKSLLGWIIPARIKRVIFLLTLYRAYAKDDRTTPADGELRLLEELDGELDLTTTSHTSLVIPDLIAQRISHNPIYSRILLQDRPQVGLQLKEIDTWLKWASTKEMVNDISRLKNVAVMVAQHKRVES